MYTDLTFLRGIARNNDDVIRITIDKFLVSIPTTSVNMKKALQSEDWDRLGAEAHKLLSSVGILKIKKMEALVRNLESNCKERENLEEVPGMVSEAIAMLEHVVTELEGIKKTDKRVSNSIKE